MKFKIGDRVEENGLFDRTGTIYGIDSMCKTYLIKWDYPQRNTWMAEEDLKLVAQTQDVPENNVGNIPTGTKFVIEVGNAHEDVDGSVYHPVKDQGWWSISEARLDKLPKLDDVLLDYTPCKEADARCDKAYKDGMDAAWNAARKICAGNFAGKLDTGMILNISASDAIEKIKEYEAAKMVEKYESDKVNDWHDIPADEMTEDQLRQAVKDLRMDMNEWVRRSTVPAAKAFDFVADLARKGIDCYQHAIKDGKVLIEWGRKEDGETLQQAAQRRTRPVHCGAQGPGGLQEKTGCGE